MPILIPPGTPQSIEVVVSDETLHFDYPGSDIVLRSCDSHNFRVPKLYVANTSPVLRELIRSVSTTSDVLNGEVQVPLPVIELPESGVILYSLLTFIFPVALILPSTAEKIMELLAVVQRYQMDSILSHIRGAISRQEPPFIRHETALRIYFLAQKHALHLEACQAARVTLRLSMTIEDLADKLDFPDVSGPYLHELWKYHEQVRTNLKSSLLEFRNSGPQNGMEALRCTAQNQSAPRWLDDYINSIAETPHLFDLIEFENARARHIQDRTSCSCAVISSQDIRAFWEALTAVVYGTIEKADSILALVKEEPASENSESDPPSVPLCLDIPDANIIIRSSDGVNFRVHKSVLAMSSPFFKDLLSLPQPSDDELVDGLPVVQLSEDASLLISLISLLYPIRFVIPDSYEKVFALLAACQKYDMELIQSFIRSDTKHRKKGGRFPTPVAAEAFRAYAIANCMGIVPEREHAARVSLAYPMTFGSLGEVLRSFDGQALCGLYRYRVANRRSRNQGWPTIWPE